VAGLVSPRVPANAPTCYGCLMRASRHASTHKDAFQAHKLLLTGRPPTLLLHPGPAAKPWCWHKSQCWAVADAGVILQTSNNKDGQQRISSAAPTVGAEPAAVVHITCACSPAVPGTVTTAAALVLGCGPTCRTSAST
jgi:hypothetical protein